MISFLLCLRLTYFDFHVLIHRECDESFVQQLVELHYRTNETAKNYFFRYCIAPANSLLPKFVTYYLFTCFQLQRTAMGIDAGFDMYPPLSKGVLDRQNWGRFIDFIKEHYKDDTQVKIRPNYINFNVGEGPMLPFEGHKFLCFSEGIRV